VSLATKPLLLSIVLSLVFVLVGVWLIASRTDDSSSDYAPQTTRTDESRTSDEVGRGRQEQRQEFLGAASREISQIYRASSWEELISVSPGAHTRDLAFALENAHRVCTLQLEQISSVNGLAESTGLGPSAALVLDFQNRFCANFNPQLVANALEKLRDDSEPLSTFAHSARLDAIAEHGPLELQEAVFERKGNIFSSELEDKLGMGKFSSDRKDLIRVAAGLELRCRLYPGCEPSGLLAIAACAPAHCSNSQTFSSRFMAEHLSPNEAVAALSLASSELRRRTR